MPANSLPQPPGMRAHSRRLSWRFIAPLLSFCAAASLAADNTVVIPDKAGDFKNGIYHAGFVVDDIDEMIDFLGEYSSLRPISRVALPGGGKRVFLSDARGQRLEVLSDPRAVRPKAPAPAYPRETVVGMGHLAIEADDVAALKKRLIEQGYAIVLQAPADFADGYIVSEVDAHRVLFVEGPGGVAIEFFEIRK